MENKQRQMTGFEYVMRKNHLTLTKLFNKMDNRIPKETIRRMIIGTSHPQDAKYRNVKIISQAFGYPNTDAFIDDVLKFEKENGQEEFEKRNHQIKKVEDILNDMNRIGFIPLEDCMDLCKTARMKRIFVTTREDFKIFVLRDAADKLDLKSKMDEMGISKLIDYKGNVIVE